MRLVLITGSAAPRVIAFLAAALVAQGLQTPTARAQEQVASAPAEAGAEASSDPSGAPAEGAGGSGAPVGVRPPSVVWAPEPTYADDGAADSAAPSEVRVRYLVELDAEGQLVNLTPRTSHGPEIDGRAEELIRLTRFAPATRDGVAIPSRFVYELILRREVPAEVATAPAPSEAPGAAAPAVPPSPPTEPPADEKVAEVVVRAASPSVTLQRSAQAVIAVEMVEEKRESADLGEVIARKTPVTVQRAGGLGSRGSFSLGGLGGERLRFFLDGVPVELMGFSGGMANVPVNLVERVEVYQGVVPVRFGGDALGGAIHLVTDQSVRDSRASASYQVGSFGTHRSTLSARWVHVPSGVFLRGTAFLDVAENDYDVEAIVSDELGRVRPATVQLFNAGYRGRGATFAAGIVDRPWAERLTLQGFVSAFDNDVQNGAMDLQNGAMKGSPFGEVTSERQSMGASARYAVGVGSTTRVEATAGWARERAAFHDLSNCAYNWFGDCVPNASRGEITRGAPIDRHLETDTFFLRATVSRQLGDDHVLRLALAPTWADRSGESRTLGMDYDPLREPRRLFTGVLGAEAESSFFGDVVQNIAFVKGYGYSVDSQEFLGTGDWRDMSREMYRVGGGDSLRVRLAPPLLAKASYEYALRMPSTDEIFGDGAITLDNLGLRPETSHNANLGLVVEDLRTRGGTVLASINGFARWSDDLIATLGQNGLLRSVNISRADALGVETRLGWTVPGDWLSLDGRVTFQDVRNRSREGQLGRAYGHRIPNIPYLFGSAAARLRKSALVTESDTVELAWTTRYVHDFPYGFHYGGSAVRPNVDSQLSHNVALTWGLQAGLVALTTTFEVQNLADEKLFDFYGVQRPGRAFFLKWTAQ